MTKKQTTIDDAAKVNKGTEVIDAELVQEGQQETAVVEFQSKELAPIDFDTATTAEIMAYNAALDGDDDNDGETEDSSGIDDLRIVQKTCDDVLDHLKSFYIPRQNNTIIESMRCALLFVFKSRSMFPEVYKKGQQPLCRSNDGFTPAGNILDENENAIPALGEVCGPDRAVGQCKYAKWSGGRKNPVPPKCGDGHNLVLIDLDSGTPYIFKCASTSITPYKAFVRELKKAGRELQIETGMKTKDCMFSFTLAVNPEPKKGPKGSAYLPMFSNIKKLDGKEMMSVMEAKRYLRQPEMLDYIMHNRPDDNQENSGSGSGPVSDSVPEGEGDFDS